MEQSHGERSEAALWDQPNDEILAAFRARSEHDSGGTARHRAGAIRAQLRRYELKSGRTVHLKEAISDAALLGEIMCCDLRLDGRSALSRAALNGTRRAFTALVAELPPPPGWSRAELRRNLDEARSRSTTVRGLRFVSRGGRPPGKDDRPVPTRAEVCRVIEALRRSPDQLAAMTADAVAIAYVTGARIGAILALRRAQLRAMPDGKWWLFVYEKARSDCRPLALAGLGTDLLGRWRHLLPDESLWADGEFVLDYPRAARLLRKGCDAAGVEQFTFHRERHAFMTDLADLLGFDVARNSGGWLRETVAQQYRHRRDAPL